MTRRLSPETKALRAARAPKLGAVIAYGSHDDGYRIGEVVEVSVDFDDPREDGSPEILLTLANGATGQRWLLIWDPWRVECVTLLSIANMDRLAKEEAAR